MSNDRAPRRESRDRGAAMSEHAAENDAGREPGETYYTENAWSGCAGSAWRTLPPAAKDGWAHAARLVAGMRYRMAQAWDEGERWRRARGGLPAVLGDPNPYRVFSAAKREETR